MRLEDSLKVKEKDLQSKEPPNPPVPPKEPPEPPEPPEN